MTSRVTPTQLLHRSFGLPIRFLTNFFWLMSVSSMGQERR